MFLGLALKLAATPMSMCGGTTNLQEEEDEDEEEEDVPRHHEPEALAHRLQAERLHVVDVLQRVALVGAHVRLITRFANTFFSLIFISENVLLKLIKS